MCGIVGYIGDGNAEKIVIEGLKKLEYRGYDSSGIAMNFGGKLAVEKRKGRITNLEEVLEKSDYPFENCHLAIGHTRWATHGAPSDINAHPHFSMDHRIAIVHNGIVENYLDIKEKLIKEHGIKFVSETDSEVIAQLLSVYYEGSLEDAMFRAISEMRGAYSICAIAADEPDKIVATRKDAPLLAGIGNGCNFLASDIPALLKHSREFYLIENGEVVVLDKNDIKIYNAEHKSVVRDVFHVSWDAASAEKDGYDHFMIKEIHEQPKGLTETLMRRLGDDNSIKLDGINLTKEDIDGFNKVYIVACGTAYHAGLIGKYAIEKFAKIPVEVDVASEFRYRDPFVDDKTLFIAISQSGETLDTLAALREAKKKGARIMSIVNVVGSSVARESDDVFYTWAGPEIAVASTKAYTTQLMCMYLVALYMGRVKGAIEDAYYNRLIEELKEIPSKLRKLLGTEHQIQDLAKTLYKTEHVFFIGRGTDSAVGLEGSLKLKEISYINSFAIAAGELKHGTIALIEKDTIVVALSTQDDLFEKMLSNIQEVKARGAFVIGVAKEGNTAIEQQSSHTIYIPKCMDEVAPILAVVPLQILAYYIAKERGCDIDKPKNLAKAVTVE